MLPNIIRNTLKDREKTYVENYVFQLQTMVENAAAALYFINNFAASANPKFRQWCSEAEVFLQDPYEVNFIEAKYGYAVEEYVNPEILGGIASYSLKRHKKTAPHRGAANFMRAPI